MILGTNSSTDDNLLVTVCSGILAHDVIPFSIFIDFGDCVEL